MINLGSPLAIEILLYFSYSSESYLPKVFNSESGKDCLLRFLSNDILVQTPTDASCYRITERGEHMVAALCNLPLPKSKTTWEIPGHPNLINRDTL